MTEGEEAKRQKISVFNVNGKRLLYMRVLDSIAVMCKYIFCRTRHSVRVRDFCQQSLQANQLVSHLFDCMCRMLLVSSMLMTVVCSVQLNSADKSLHGSGLKV